MLIAGEASGDLLAAELVRALRQEFASAPPQFTSDYQPLSTSLEPRFFGAGGPRMAAAGVDLAVDMTAHSVIGLSDAVKQAVTFSRIQRQLYRLALDRQPDVIICVDFDYFNRRFTHAIKQFTRSHADWFHPWSPKLVKYVSPQVWASREGRAYKMAPDLDLLLSTFAFEKEWYAKRVPQLRVEFVGNPIVDRYGKIDSNENEARSPSHTPEVLLLPGSRPGELRRHLPVLVEAANRIAAARPVSLRMVLPQESLQGIAAPFQNQIPGLKTQIGQLGDALRTADLAITKSGTITLECAYFGVPAVVFYKTSAITYFVGRRIVTVKHIAMPNLLANETLFPEFIQGSATGENLARAALDLLNDQPRRQQLRAKMAQVVSILGAPGASARAAKAILRLMNEPPASSFAHHSQP